MLLLSRAIEEARISRGPWLIAGDFQQEPEELLKWAAPMLEAVGAKITCSEQPTNRPGEGTWAKLDYFIASPEMSNAIGEVRLTTEFAWEEDGEKKAMAAKPHALVVVRVRSSAVQRHMEALKMPRKFERHKPVGCARAPRVPQEEQGGGGLQSRLASEWRQVMQCAEAELCGVCLLFRNRGRRSSTRIR